MLTITSMWEFNQATTFDKAKLTQFIISCPRNSFISGVSNQHSYFILFPHSFEIASLEGSNHHYHHPANPILPKLTVQSMLSLVSCPKQHEKYWKSDANGWIIMEQTPSYSCHKYQNVGGILIYVCERFSILCCHVWQACGSIGCFVWSGWCGSCEV